MVKNLIGAVILILAVVGGAFAADTLKPGPKRLAPAGDAHEAGEGEDAETHDGEDAGDGHGEPAKSGGNGGGHGEPVRAGEVSYYKFSRQFIVPVVEGSDLTSLVILDLNLELDPGVAEEAYALEPKIRDSLMTELFALSNEGRFQHTRFTDPTNYAEIRARLLAAARVVMPEGVEDILILDMARQEQR